MDRFKIVSEYKMMGDQPKAGGNPGKRDFARQAGADPDGRYRLRQDLYHGQHHRAGKADTGHGHNKTLAAQLHGEFKEFFPDNAVEYFVS